MQAPKVTKNRVLEYVATSERISMCITKICPPNYLDEFRSFFYLKMCEMQDDKLIKAYEDGYIDFLCIKIISNQLRNPGYEFHRKFLKNKYDAGLNLLLDAILNPSDSEFVLGASGDKGIKEEINGAIDRMREEYDEMEDLKWQRRDEMMRRFTERLDLIDQVLWRKYYHERMKVSDIAKDTGILDEATGTFEHINYNTVYYRISKVKEQMVEWVMDEESWMDADVANPSFKKFIDKTRKQ